MDTSLELNKLLAFAREHSPYYARHWQHVAPQVTTLDELPLVDPEQYWAHSENFADWPVLTSTVERALVFKTGGTASAGKLSVFTRDEWQTLVRDFGGQLAGQLKPGDRVANLFFVGDLYASFIFIHDALAYETAGVTEYPFTGAVEPAVLVEAIRQHAINVLAGVPAQLLGFADVLQRQGQTLTEVDALLYGGKACSPGNCRCCAVCFPMHESPPSATPVSTPGSSAPRPRIAPWANTACYPATACWKSSMSTPAKSSKPATAAGGWC